MANNYFDRYDKRYDIAKKFDNSNGNTRKLTEEVNTGIYIACTTFIQRRGQFRVRKNDNGKLEVYNPQTGERIKFTSVARNFKPNTKHIFQKVVWKYDDGTEFTGYRLQNQYVPTR